jgi:hypothetical protein
VDHRCRPRLHDGRDQRRLSMSSSTSPRSDRPEPSKSLGCPSVARQRSRRRLRNVGHEPSMEMTDVGHRCRPRLHAGKPTPRATRSAVFPSGATDGHPRWFEGSSKSLPSGWSKGSNRSIPWSWSKGSNRSISQSWSKGSNRSISADGSDRRRSSTSSSSRLGKPFPWSAWSAPP